MQTGRLENLYFSRLASWRDWPPHASLMQVPTR